ncbi:28S ribosomal protein S27, mitochondrial-like [Macrosteles quadrilineatus]|uniref:28S ribosomal protein S27, mitochondrial-like n=1 Tax=Macrosteles quadrilineatus TaxID=74068 RepID=UPI0023E142F7|nr:28S ribosomal protein S27, mitochondrial-like [Macrosteles quadrilineatus]
MWKLLPHISKNLLCRNSVFKVPQIRLFLSESYKLDNVWKERLQSPILKRINVSDMFYELDNQFQHFAYASALDIDLFVNAVNDDSYFDEIEDVLYKLRLSPEAVNMLPSTHHAIVRLYMEWNKTQDLMRVLDDRLNYGVFPDDYCSLFMIDSFVKAQNFRDAAKVSILGMLQEEISNPLLKYYSLYSCHKYLENPIPWKDAEDGQKGEEEEDEDEVVKVRVRFLRNPYFDDNFDLVEPHHLIGKTMTYIGSGIDSCVGKTYKLLGLILHEKFDEATSYITALSSSKESDLVYEEGLALANRILEEKSKTESKDESFKASVNRLKEILNTSFTDTQVNKRNLLEELESTIKELTSKHEKVEIDKQLDAYKEWERLRERLLIEQVEKINREKQLAEVQRQKQLLQEKEEELFFFENEPKLDLIIEEKEKKRAEEEERNQKIKEALQPPKKIEKWNKPIPPEPTIEDYFDDNIPLKLVKTK